MKRASALVCALALMIAGCSSAPNAGGVAPSAPVSNQVSARFRPALANINTVRAARSAGDAGRTRAATDELVTLGITLIQSRMPHDLARPDVPRYTAARRAFGDALKEGTYARDANDLPALDAAVTRLEGATRRWSDAHLGLAAETTL